MALEKNGGVGEAGGKDIWFDKAVQTEEVRAYGLGGFVVLGIEESQEGDWCRHLNRLQAIATT